VVAWKDFAVGVDVQVCVSKRGGCRAWVCGREEYSRNIYLERLGGGGYGGVVEVVFEN